MAHVLLFSALDTRNVFGKSTLNKCENGGRFQSLQHFFRGPLNLKHKALVRETFCNIAQVTGFGTLPVPAKLCV